MIPVIDMHCDTIAGIHGAWAPAKKQSAESKKEAAGQAAEKTVSGSTACGIKEEARGGSELRENTMHVDLLRMKQAGYLCQSFALYTDLKAVKDSGKSPFSHVCELSDTFDREVGANGDLIRPAYSASDIFKNQADGLMSALKTIEEGGVYEGKLENLQAMYEKGVRKSTLTWNYPNELAFPNPSKYDEVQKEYVCVELDEENGLTDCGISFVREMERMGMLIDLSHLNDAGIWDVFRYTKPETPILASHSNARGAAFHPRNLSDEMLKKLAERGGVAGINFCAAFLNEAYTYSAHEEEALSRTEDMLRHMKYIKNIAGIDVIGLGTDFDGIGGDLEIDGAGEMQKLADAMSLSGFTTGEIEKVFYKNVLRVYQTVLG